MPWKMGSIPPTEIRLVDTVGAKTFYPSAKGDRFVVSLIVGYSEAESANEAAALARCLVQGGGTIWTVLDRATGEFSQWEDHGPPRDLADRPAPAPTKPRWTCSVCGGANVQRAVWSNPNTGETRDDVLEGAENCWCSDCKAHVALAEGQDPPAGSEWWIGTARLPVRPADGGWAEGRYASDTNRGLEWQVSDGPESGPTGTTRGSSNDFDSAIEALLWACKPGVTVHFEDDYDPSALAAASKALNALCTTIVQTGGMLHGENIGDEPGENEDAPAADPDWVDLGSAYLLACEALGFEPLYSDDPENRTVYDWTWINVDPASVDGYRRGTLAQAIEAAQDAATASPDVRIKLSAHGCVRCTVKADGSWRFA